MFSSSQTETPFPLNTIPSPLPPSAPGNYRSTYCLYECTYYMYLTKVESDNVCSKTGLFHLAQWLSLFTQDIACVRISFLSKANSVGCTYHVCLAIHPSVDTWVVRTFGLL